MVDAWGQFGNPEKWKRLLLEVLIRGLVKTHLIEKTCVRAIVNCRLCRSITCSFKL
jgi:hypothetical protein